MTATDRFGREIAPDPEFTYQPSEPAGVHVIPLERNRYWAADLTAGGQSSWHDRGRWVGDPRVIHVPRDHQTGSDRYSVGYLDDTAIYNDNQGRRVGGRYAFLSELPSVIDNFGGTARERREKQAAGLEIEAAVGDLLVLTSEAEATAWRIVTTGWGNRWLALELVSR